MTTTIGKLATEVGASHQEVLGACARAGVIGWSEHTPLDDGETVRVRAALSTSMLPPPPPPPAPMNGAFGPPVGLPPPPSGAPLGPSPALTYLPPPPGGPGGTGGGRVVAIVLGSVVAGLAVLIAAVTMLGRTVDDRVGPAVSDFGSFDRSATALPEVLRAGDCWDDRSDLATSPDFVEAAYVRRECSAAHDAEVYGVVNHPAGMAEPFPGDDALIDFTDQECHDRFAGFVGLSYEESQLDYVMMWPRAEAWALGDREVVCSVMTLDGSQLTGTMAGSGR